MEEELEERVHTAILFKVKIQISDNAQALNVQTNQMAYWAILFPFAKLITAMPIPVNAGLIQRVHKEYERNDKK